MSSPVRNAAPAENLIRELQQGRKMQMVEALQVKLLEDQRRSLRHFESVQEGLGIMRAGALQSRPATSPASPVSDRSPMQRMSFSFSLRQEVEAARAACGLTEPLLEGNAEGSEGGDHSDYGGHGMVISIAEPTPPPQAPPCDEIDTGPTSPPREPQSRSPRRDSGEPGGTGLNLKGFKKMKTAGTVKFRNQEVDEAESPSRYSDATNNADEDEDEFFYHHIRRLFAESNGAKDALQQVPVYRQKGEVSLLSQQSDTITFSFCQRGESLATADAEGVSILNKEGCVWSCPISLTAMAYSEGGVYLAAADQQGLIHLWNLKAATSTTFNAGCQVLALAWHEHRLAAATTSKVRLFAVPEFQELTALPGVAHSLCFSPDGTFLAAGGPVEDATRDDGKGTGLVIWDTSVYGRLGCVVFSDTVQVTAFRGDGLKLAVAHGELISILKTDGFPHEGDLCCSGRVHALAWSPNLRCLASGGEDRTVCVWDMVMKDALFTLAAQDQIVQLAWSARGLAFGHQGGIGMATLELEPVEQAEHEEEPAMPQFVFSVKAASSGSGAPQAPKQADNREGFQLNVTRDRVDADPAALDLGSRVPGLQFASTAPRLVKANFLASCCFMPHDQSLVLAGEELCEWQVAGAKLREIHLRDAAKALAVSPCGGYLALGSALALTVYRLGAQGEEVVVSRKVTSNIVSLAFSANHMLAVGTIEHKVLVFHITDDKEADVLEHEQANSLCFSPRGDVLAVVGGDDISGTVSLWQVDRESSFLGSVVTRSAARSASFSATGKILAVGCDDARVVLLLPDHGFKCWTELRSAVCCRSLAWCGAFLAAAGEREASVFNVSSSQIVLQLPRQQEKICSISLNSSGSLMACCLPSGVALYELEDSEVTTSPSIQVPQDADRYKSRGTTASLSFGQLPPEHMHSIKLSYANAEEEDDIQALKVTRLKSTGSCSNLSLSHEHEEETPFREGTLVESIPLPKVGGHPDDLPDDWQVDGKGSGPPQAPLAPPELRMLKPRISVTDVSHDGGSGYASPAEHEEDPEAASLRKRALLARDLGLDPCTQCKISIAACQEGVPLKLKHVDEVCSLYFNPAGTCLVAGGYDQALVLWDVASRARTADFKLDGEIICVVFSPCGEFVFCGDGERVLRVFKGRTLELLSEMTIPEQFHSLAAVDSPTNLLAVGSTGVVRLFSVPDLQEVVSLEHGGQVHSLSYCPSLKMLAAAGGIDITESGLLDYKAKSGGMKAMVWKSTEFSGVWDEVSTINYKDFVHAAAFAPSGRALALAGEDRMISILSVGKGFQKAEELLCGAGIRCLAWAPNSRFLASAGEDMRVSVWDVLFKRVVLHLPKADDWLCSISFSADSKWLASCGYGQETVDLWPIQVEESEP
ncbi:unnamed protein product [Effrenium voratum]|nr:unnamed protein product [Effrenium voratum]